MSENRIKELQNFAEDFKRKLDHAKKRYEKSPSKSFELSKDQKNSEVNNSNLLNKSLKIRNHKKNCVSNIFLNKIIKIFYIYYKYSKRKIYLNQMILGYQIHFLENH